MNWREPLIVMLLCIIFIEMLMYIHIINLLPIDTWIWIIGGTVVFYYGWLSIKFYIEEQKNK